jgi:predicted negative regulator of RcsB-dependent stress response
MQSARSSIKNIKNISSGRLPTLVTQDSLLAALMTQQALEVKKPEERMHQGLMTLTTNQGEGFLGLDVISSAGSLLTKQDPTEAQHHTKAG